MNVPKMPVITRSQSKKLNSKNVVPELLLERVMSLDETETNILPQAHVVQNKCYDNAVNRRDSPVVNQTVSQLDNELLKGRREKTIESAKRVIDIINRVIKINEDENNEDENKKLKEKLVQLTESTKRITDIGNRKYD